MPKLLPISFLIFLMACQQPSQDGQRTTAAAPSAAAATIDAEAFELSPVPGTNLQTAVLRNLEGRVVEMGTVDASLQKQGDWTKYHTNKSLPAEIATFVDGQYNGALIKLDVYGKISEMMHYKMNELHGPYVKFRIAYPEIEANYVDGKLDGKYRLYDFRNGKLKRETEFKMGEKDGLDRQFNDNGSLLIQYEYKNGELVE